jgi:iron complex transport system ATP-binding protein
LLEVKNLSCGYEGKIVLQNVSFSVKKGDFVAVLGPNGAGKTTLFRTCGRYLKPQAGNVYYQGKNIFQMPTKELAQKMAVLPQDTSIPFSFSVEEFVSLGRYPYLRRWQKISEKDQKVIDQAFCFTQTSHLRRRKMNQLSGGERQRVYLAQALSQQPEILLLDEPIAHLDIHHQLDVFKLLKKISGEGKTVVVILHNLNFAFNYCQRIILLKAGKIVATGPSEEIMKEEILSDVFSVRFQIIRAFFNGQWWWQIVPFRKNEN